MSDVGSILEFKTHGGVYFARLSVVETVYVKADWKTRWAIVNRLSAKLRENGAMVYGIRYVHKADWPYMFDDICAVKIPVGSTDPLIQFRDTGGFVL